MEKLIYTKHQLLLGGFWIGLPSTGLTEGSSPTRLPKQPLSANQRLSKPGKSEKKVKEMAQREMGQEHVYMCVCNFKDVIIIKSIKKTCEYIYMQIYNFREILHIHTTHILN